MFKKRASIKCFIVLFVFGFFQFLFLGISNAATHYVSPTGTGTWANSTNINTPCSASTAMTNSKAGDTVYFRGGTYEVAQNPSGHASLEPSNGGTSGNPIIFKAYPGETPIINGTTDTGKDNVLCIGNGGKDYITWDGFTVQADNGVKMGSVYFAGTAPSPHSVGCQLLNCTVNGGTTAIATHDNRETLRIDYSDYVLIQRCRFYNVNHTSNDYEDNSGIKFYNSYNVTIEYCEFYNMATGGSAINCKRDAQNVTIRYNYIHDCYYGILGIASLANMTLNNAKIYNNVIINSGYTGIGFTTDDVTYYDNDHEIYNNTIYNTNRGISFPNNQNGHGAKIYNNIIVNQSHPMTGGTGATLKEADHNQWGTGTFKITMRLYGTSPTEKTYNTLASWQTSTELESAIDVGCGSNQNPGCGDLSSDPLFTNGSGSLNILSDFNLQAGSPCKLAGRSGADMGANISLVGLGGVTTGIKLGTGPALRIGTGAGMTVY